MFCLNPIIKPAACTAPARQVFLWDLAKRELLASAVVGFTARAVAISPALAGGRHHLAVGGAKGHIKVGLRGCCWA